MSRELPHSNEAEQAILGGMMVYPSVSGVVYDQGLEPSDFYLDIHQRIFSAMMDITNSGKPVDVTTLIARLQDIEQLHLVGGADYIIKLSDTTFAGYYESFLARGERCCRRTGSSLEFSHVFP